MAEAFNVGVVGTGYLGFATGAYLANLGYRVVGVNKDKERIAMGRLEGTR